jgi:hypothetical protein
VLARRAGIGLAAGAVTILAFDHTELRCPCRRGSDWRPLCEPVVAARLGPRAGRDPRGGPRGPPGGSASPEGRLRGPRPLSRHQALTHAGVRRVSTANLRAQPMRRGQALTCWSISVCR